MGALFWSHGMEVTRRRMHRGLCLVEQYKTRTRGTWSLADLTAVLRDLRRSLQDSRPQHARYRFVTDGRAGRLGAFESFVARLDKTEGPGDLDDEKKRKFTHTLCLGDREFLDHLAIATRSKVDGETTAEEREVLFHLLRRFEMKFCVRSEELAGAVEARLRPYVCNLGDEAGVRKRLIGDLMERLASGETKLDKDGLDAMLQAAQLMPDRLRKVGNLARTLEGGLHRHLRYLRYRRGNDVRDAPCWSETKPVLVIAGESGAGKSWQLARLVEESVANGEPVVFVRADGSAKDILTRAADEIWHFALGETSEKRLQAISNVFRQDAFQLRPPLYSIAVDDVQSIDVARSLVRQDWTSLGARLVLNVPLTLASALNAADGEQVSLHRVGDFSIEQLDALLRMHGHRWADLAEDLKRLLRKPVLAGLFLDLSVASFQDAPQSEYEIFQAFWERISERGDAGDKGIVTALADRAFEGKPYPLPRQHWSEIGLNNKNLAALEAAGWLICHEHGEVEFAHDRLLNWAVAQSLSRRFAQRELSVDELFNRMTGESDGDSADPLSRYGYVPMDVLWLLSEEDPSQAALGRLVERMEKHRAFGGEGRNLYTKLLPTLGQRTIPILLQRLDRIAGISPGDYRVGLIGDAFVGLARRESVDIRPDIDSLLQSRSWDKQSVAVKALAAAPDIKHLDRLWEVHQQRLDAIGHTPDRRFQRGHEATFLALRAGVAQRPEWLRDRILSADAGMQPVFEFGFLLSGLDDPGADRIWREVRDVLMDKLGRTNPRSLIQCIARFGDGEKKNFVLEHLSYSGELVSAAAMVALAVLDPEEAIERITVIDDEQRFFRNEWLPLLLRADSELTRARIRELAVSGPRGQQLIEEYFEKRPADLDDETFGLVLETREQQLQEHIEEGTERDVLWPFFPLRFFGRMCRPGILGRLQEKAGSPLEMAIAELAYSRLRGNDRTQDHILEPARRTLMLFAGDSISTLINRELESEHFWIRHGGLNWAWVYGNVGTIDRLEAIARRPIPCDSAGKAETDGFQEFIQAITGLAALGADKVLVDTILNCEFVEVPLHLGVFREYRGSMSKSLTAETMRRLQSTETSVEDVRRSVLVAWLSQDQDMIPVVRAVLGRAEPESPVAAHSCIALQDLGDKSAEFAMLAEGLAFTKKNCWHGLKALIALGDEGVDGLRRWLDRTGETEDVDYRQVVIRALYERVKSRSGAVDAAAEQCLNNRVFLQPLYEIAAESHDAAVREMILEKAFSDRSPVVREPLDAIRGLAKVDTARAEEAIELALSYHPKIETELCRLLVHVAPESAVEKLIDAALALERESLADAVGRALRRADSKAVTDNVLMRLDGSEMERKIACRISGWLRIAEISDALECAADRESSIVVRRAALEALYRHREEEEIRCLFAKFQAEQSSARRWAFFVAILETADPHLLSDREDALWLGRILTKNVPYAFEHYANLELKKRKREERQAPLH